MIEEDFRLPKRQHMGVFINKCIVVHNIESDFEAYDGAQYRLITMAELKVLLERRTQARDPRIGNGRDAIWKCFGGNQFIQIASGVIDCLDYSERGDRPTAIGLIRIDLRPIDWDNDIRDVCPNIKPVGPQSQSPTDQYADPSADSFGGHVSEIPDDINKADY